MNQLASRRTLRRIETDLASSDPRLAGLLKMFTRLTHGEEMPGTERLKAGPVRILARLRRAAGLSRPRARSRAWLGPTLVLVTALALYCLAAASGIARYAGHACQPSTNRFVAHACQPPADHYPMR